MGRKKPKKKRPLPARDPGEVVVQEGLRAKFASGIALTAEERELVAQRRIERKAKKKKALASMMANPTTMPPKALGTPTRYIMRISYFGPNFHGFQKQNPQPGQEMLRTVESVLLQHGRVFLQQMVKFFPAGRTDSGVTARGQVVAFDAVTPLGPEAIKAGMNAMLPADVRVGSVVPALNSKGLPFRKFNVMGCKWKRYVYTIDTCAVSESNLCKWLLDGVTQRRPDVLDPPSETFDVERMQRAASLLEGTHDFKAYQSQGGRENTVRTLFRCRVERFVDGELLGPRLFDVRSLVAASFMGRETRKARQDVVKAAQVEKIVEGKSGLANTEAKSSAVSVDEAKASDYALDGLVPPSDRIVIVMEGAGFLFNMCRIIAGTLCEVGCGSRDFASLQNLFTDPEAIRSMAGPTMPALGLCMDHVEYDVDWK